MAALGSNHALLSSLPAFLQQSRGDIHAKFVDLEWLQRNRLAEGAQATRAHDRAPSQWTRLQGRHISARNRYVNVEPYAQNRIKLRVAGGVNDYINASPIRLGKRRYIATQGPTDASVNHFYRMVASEVGDPAVVVMLTQTHEAGKEKCFQYYPLSADDAVLEIPPDEGMRDDFRGRVVLESIARDESSNSEVRRMTLHTTQDSCSETKRIVHFLFSGWPDFLVPEGDDRAALLELVRCSAAVNASASSSAKTTSDDGRRTVPGSAAADLANTDQDNPRIVHCSAGVGRSGTFIALDYLLALMYAGGLDNLPADRDPIAETVDSLRQQRMMMVQGESQFMFLYDVMRAAMAARLSETRSQGEVPR